MEGRYQEKDWDSLHNSAKKEMQFASLKGSIIAFDALSQYDGCSVCKRKTTFPCNVCKSSETTVFVYTSLYLDMGSKAIKIKVFGDVFGVDSQSDISNVRLHYTLEWMLSSDVPIDW